MRRPAVLGALGVFVASLAAAAAVAHAAAPAGEASAAAGSEVAPAPPSGPTYDGRFNFVRIRWDDRRGFSGRGGGGEALWEHDMRRGAERYFATILDEVTLIDPHIEGKVLRFDDPELAYYPVAYIVEVGYWTPTDAEVIGLRNFLTKGGFLIVDDFRGPQELLNFQYAMERVLPGMRFLPLDEGHRIWDTFFHIPDPSTLAPPTYPQHVPMYLGIFEANDPDGRVMAVINFNNDIAEYWEWSAEGFLPIALTNDAYKFGVNYIIYSMTH